MVKCTVGGLKAAENTNFPQTTQISLIAAFLEGKLEGSKEILSENWASLAGLPTRDSGRQAGPGQVGHLLVGRVRHSSPRLIMLRINPLQPPRPFVAISAPAGQRAPGGPAFVAAEDYDSTGIMAGVDPSESRYWWLPELYGPESAPTAPVAHATSRAGEPSAAAA